MERSLPPSESEPADLALQDDLTGTWNRRYLRRLLDDDWQSLVTTLGTITLLVLDLDFFKEINDEHGHLVGDEVLKRASEQLRAHFRAEDRLIRYGGDEFVVALFGAGAQEARALAERARKALATVEIPGTAEWQARSLPLSFSMGIASFPDDGSTGEEILAVADRRLYAEKRARRPSSSPWGRRQLVALTIAGLALAGLGAWLGWRLIRAAPEPPPAVGAAEGAPATAPGPLAEIVVRDEVELQRLRAEVRRLQAELAGALPAESRTAYEGRIRELEGRLTEAGEGSAAAAEGEAESSTATESRGSEISNDTGMEIGERRLREGGTLHEGAPSSGSDPAAAAVASGHRASEPAGVSPRAPGESRVDPPQLLEAIRPEYPAAARARRRMANVELRVRVDASGKVTAVEPVGPPLGLGFDESARQAAFAARFRPGMRDGVAVEMETRLRIRFLLEGPPR